MSVPARSLATRTLPNMGAAMLEYERAYELTLAPGSSPYSVGQVCGFAGITDYYLEPTLGDMAFAPACRVRCRFDGTGEQIEITIKTPTSDPLARNEYTYPVPSGSFRASPDVPRVCKTRYQLRTLRRPGGDLPIPDAVVCTLDVFSHPAGQAPVLEMEGAKADVDALAAELGTVPWLVARDRARRVGPTPAR